MSLLNWLLDHCHTLELNIARDYALQAYHPELNDFLVSISVNGETSIGRGVSRDVQQALVSAVAEAVERAILVYHRQEGRVLTSNGIAVHTDLATARQRALAELLERDAFFCHYLTHQPFQIVNDMPSPYIAKVQQELVARGVVLKLAKLASPGSSHIYVATCFGDLAPKPFGAFTGASCKSDAVEAAERAVTEALVLTSGWNMRTKDLVWDPKGKMGPLYHHALMAKPENAALIKDFYEQQQSAHAVQPLDISRVVFEELAKPPQLTSCPLFCIRADSSDAQQLYFGETDKKVVNKGRLAQFLNLNTYTQPVNFNTHPFI